MAHNSALKDITERLNDFIAECEAEKEAYKASCDETLDKARQQLEASTQATLSKERESLETARKALDDEIAGMQKIPVRQNDVVSINCGGHILMAKRATLCSVSGSVLASMFSGRWEESLEKDDKGNVFFDFNPDCFIKIVNYLRLRLIEDPAHSLPAPEIPPSLRAEFKAVAQYLGLEDIFRPKQLLKFEATQNVRLAEDGRLAESAGNSVSFITGHQQGNNDMDFAVKYEGGHVYSAIGFGTHRSISQRYTPFGFYVYSPPGVFYYSNGNVENSNGGNTNYRSYASGDVVKCCFSQSSRQVSFYVNDLLVGTQNAPSDSLSPCVFMVAGSERFRLVA
eukprot:GILK01011955.1.p1 GENE.GILK01011955.1~~GILK01011955.1.p1  ORF type:complete len:339 (+),score=28.38 GILK01011955.1:39-1055(+)